MPSSTNDARMLDTLASINLPWEWIYFPHPYACVILYNVLRKQANEDFEALGTMVNNGGPEDDNDNTYLDA